MRSDTVEILAFTAVLIAYMLSMAAMGCFGIYFGVGAA